jgi:hypothetical protein
MKEIMSAVRAKWPVFEDQGDWQGENVGGLSDVVNFSFLESVVPSELHRRFSSYILAIPQQALQFRETLTVLEFMGGSQNIILCAPCYLTASGTHRSSVSDPLVVLFPYCL